MGISLPWSKCLSSSSQGIGDLRFEDDLRFHFKVGHVHFVFLRKTPQKRGFLFNCLENARAGSLTPLLGVTEAEFSRPVGVDPMITFVLIRIRKRPLKSSGLPPELCPFVGDIVDE